MNQGASEDLLRTIDRLWSESFHCLLSTHSVKFPGYPFGSVVPICRDGKGNPLLMISHLAQHTRNLDADNHCSMTMVHPHHDDVLQWTRLTCLGQTEPATSSTALERYYRYFPEGRRYHKELNFSLYRLLPRQFYLIAGFGSARWFEVDRVLETPRFNTAAELEILYRLNARDHTLLGRLLARQGIAQQAPAHAVGADPRGLDIRQGERLSRLHLDSPIDDDKHYIERLEAELAD